MKISIDVVIPSFRLEEKYILPILQLHRPEHVAVKFYLVADNPALIPADSIKSQINNVDVFLLINEKNSGAAKTRNRGMEAGKGDWILFLDDDVSVRPDLLDIYSTGIINSPDEIGFIGFVDMPEPETIFAKAVKINGSMDIFSVAGRKDSFAWGATANIMIRRNAAGNIRFSEIYPKAGGGEEVDFFLRVRERNNYKNYKSLPQAAVIHPWWQKGRTDFFRFYRYGQGNSYLSQFNPSYKSIDFLNTAEMLLFFILALPVSYFVSSHLLKVNIILLIAPVLFSYLTAFLVTYSKTRKADFIIPVHLMLLNLFYETGILFSNLRRFRFAGIGERFNYDGSIKKNFLRLNRYKIIKLTLYAVLLIILIYTWQ